MDPAGIVVYDGSLPGLLSVVFDAFDQHLSVKQLVRRRRHQASLLGAPVEVATDETKASRVWSGLQKLEGFDIKTVLKCWLFDTTQSDSDLAHLCIRLFRDGAWAAEDYRDEAVFRCKQVVKKMGREIHRTHAFVRFAEAEDGLYFARIDPDFDVLPLAVAHFEDRYQDQEWIIWDGRRGYGYWFRPGQTVSQRIDPTDFDAEPGALEAGFSESQTEAAHEDGFKTLWTAYFDCVNIAARANPKLHRQHVPTRYWRHLTEKRHKHTGA